MAIRYSHTQTGARMRLFVFGVLIIALVAMVVGLTRDPKAPGWIWPMVLTAMALSFLSAWVFSQLTVAVDEQALRWYFGGGIPRFSVSRGEIRGARAIKLPWYYGMGIHYFPGRPGRWVYNVGLGQGVEITKHDGSVLCIGSDDAANLAAALSA
jgi:hypothetical protein